MKAIGAILQLRAKVRKTSCEFTVGSMTALQHVTLARSVILEAGLRVVASLLLDQHAVDPKH